jgi:hypothetical protein
MRICQVGLFPEKTGFLPCQARTTRQLETKTTFKWFLPVSKKLFIFFTLAVVLFVSSIEQLYPDKNDHQRPKSIPNIAGKTDKSQVLQKYQ